MIGAKPGNAVQGRACSSVSAVCSSNFRGLWIGTFRDVCFTVEHARLFGEADRRSS